jgi:hypothetical protein
MNIVIVHYHLNRGGVTRVVANQILSLESALRGRDEVRVAVFYGGRAHGWPGDIEDQLKSVHLQLVPLQGLDYDEEPTADPESLAAGVMAQLKHLDFAPDNTVLHVHNHSLGKNVSLPGALGRLAENGYAQLLQIHDFAEDFRAENFLRLVRAVGADRLAATLYPQAPSIHYALLNRRDHAVLERAGVASPRLHFLPNPVPQIDRLPSCASARSKLQASFGIPPADPYLLYPVRGIRRKNLGEFLLWAVLADKPTTLGITLAPLNPAEQTRYRHWKDVAAECRLRCHFETGEKWGLTFEENMAAADRILTTSVAEGFGMVYLEAWLAERGLAGRNLPEVTSDFVEAGLELDSLYDRLNVPLEWVGQEAFRRLLAGVCSDVLSAYGREVPSRQQLDRVFAAKQTNGLVDFADLNERLQEHVIRKAAGNTMFRDELLELNPVLRRSTEVDAQTIARNKQVIEKTYAIEPSGHRLLAIFQALLTAERSQPVSSLAHGQEILDSFLDLTRVRPIRG